MYMSISYNIQYVHVILESRYCMGNSNKKQRENTVIYIVLALLDFIRRAQGRTGHKKITFLTFLTFSIFFYFLFLYYPNVNAFDTLIVESFINSHSLLF